MENNTAVLEKPKKEKEKEKTGVSSMADANASIAPEKRRLFRKACNHSARTVLFEIIMLNFVAGIILAVYFLVGNGSELINAASSGSGDFTETLTALTSSPSFILWAIIANGVGAVCANLLASFLHSNARNYHLFEGFKEGRLTFKLFVGGLVTTMGAMYGWSIIYTVIQTIFKFSDPTSSAAQEQAMILLSKDNIPGLIAYCSYVCILAPITEELLFRGVILKTVSKYNVGFAAFVSALFFGLVHGNIVQTPGAFLAGLALAYVAIRSGSLRGPIIIHMMLNTFSTVISILGVNVPEGTKEYNWINIGAFGIMAALIIGAIIIVCVCGKKLKWEAIDPTTNHVLLPKANTRVKYRIPHFITCIWVLVFLYVSVETMLANAGQELITVKLVNLLTDYIATIK